MKRLFLLAFLFAATSSLLAQSEETAASKFYDLSTIQEVNIKFPYANWQNLLDSLRMNGDNFLLGSVTINQETYKEVGIRYLARNGFNPGDPRNGLLIQLNYTNRNQTLDGHATIQLSSALRDPSMVREVLSYEIARQYMPAPRANYADVSINGSTYALMVNVETIEKAFLDKNFGESEGALFKARSYSPYDNYPEGCKQNTYGSLEYEPNMECFFYNFTELGEGGWNDLQKLAQTLDESPEQIASVLDVDRTLWMLAFNNVVVNLSSYTGRHPQNFYLYKDKFGKFSPILFETNFAFGTYKGIGQGSDLSFDKLVQLNPLVHINNPTKPLIAKLLSNDDYRKTYFSHLRVIVYDWFNSGQYETRAKQLQDMVKDLYAADPSKYYSVEDFENSLTATVGKRSKIPGVVELMSKRTEYLTKNPKIAVVPPIIKNTRVIGRKQYSSERVTTFRVVTDIERFPKRIVLMYRFSDKEPFQAATMLDDGKHNDGEANDDTFGVTIIPKAGQDTMEYYIAAENAQLQTFEPVNYMWERNMVTLEELNK
ncbi:MAG: CotH kinase family protein [Bacteroidota bacterium]